MNNWAKFWSTNQYYLRVYNNHFHYQRNIISIAILCMYYSQYSFDTLFVSLHKNSWLIGIMKFGFRMKLAWNNLIGFFAKGSVFHGYFCPFLAEKKTVLTEFFSGGSLFSLTKVQKMLCIIHCLIWLPQSSDTLLFRKSKILLPIS